METPPMYNDQAASTRAADEMIMNVLRGAGPVGVHIDDVTQIVGLPGNKDTLARLKYLQLTRMVEQMNGQLWKITDKGGEVMARADPPPEANGSITLPHGTNLPEINLPGIGKFNSYKNSFQEYCQKVKLAIPVYRVDHKIGVGFVGSVSFGTNSIRASRAVSTSKEATLFVAFEALKQLGYFSDEVNFKDTSILGKRKEGSNLEDAPPSKKPFTVIASTFKSRLNELAQKNKLPLPTYNTVTTNSGFFSTCQFNGREFKSTSTFAKKKDSEQSAAQVAVQVLIGKVPESTNGNHDEAAVAALAELDQPKMEGDVTSMIQQARTAAAGKKVVSLKNRLQEYCQRLKKDLPTYTTALTSNQSFVSTVVVDGAKYTGDVRNSKKNAETSAAEGALKCLGLMA